MRTNGVKFGSSLLIVQFALLYWLPLLLWTVLFAPQFAGATGESAPFWNVLWITVRVCFLSTLWSVLAAYAFLLMWLLSRRLREVILVIMVIPLVIGFLARNYAWIGVLSTSAGHSLMPGLLYSELGVYVVMSTIFIPTAFFVLLQGLSSVSAEMVDAARTLGASDRRILWRLVIPLTFRAQLLAVLLNFAVALDYFVTPRMIGGGKLPFMSMIVLTYFNTGNIRMASLMAIDFLLAVVLPALGLCILVLRRRERQSGF